MAGQIDYSQKMSKPSSLKIQFIIVLMSALLFIPFLGIVHLFDWDEVNFAESAREMIVSGDYLTVQINFLPFWEKPPLFIWLQVLSMKVFGINEFAARFPNAICGIATLLVLFNIGRKLKDNRFGILWVLAYAGSVMPFFYFKSGIIDPWFNLFIFLGIYFLILYFSPADQQKMRNSILSATFAGLAILTKGPVGFLLISVSLVIFLISTRFKVKIKTTDVLIYFLVLVLVGGSWFIIQILSGNYETVIDFITYQIRLFRTEDAGHGGFPGFHVIVLLFGVFPSSILAIKSFRKDKIEEPLFMLAKKWMVILFWVVLILFTIVRTKIIHYSSLTYFPISFLAALFVYNASYQKNKWNIWQSILILIITTLITVPIMLVQFLDKYKHEIIANGWIHDEFTVGNLQAEVNWTGIEFLLGLIPLLAVVFVFLLLKKEQVLKRAVSLWLITIISAFFIMNLFVPRIEKYTQGALIEFYQSNADKDVYLKTLNFKSYAIYFYGKLQPPENKNYYDEGWLKMGEIDKDVYFVTKTNKEDQIAGFTELEKLYEKNGFSFYKRKSK